MIPDIKINDYYLQFIYNTKADIIKYEKNIEIIISVKNELYKYLTEHKDDINSKCNIDLNIYTEYTEQKYNSTERLYNIAIKLLKSIENQNNRVIILQIAKYCNLLRNEYKNNKLIKLAKKRKDIKFATYRKYVSAYYSKVHECLLKGMAYKYSHGIGMFIINHWKIDISKSRKKYHLDYAATNAKKKELLSKGIKLYDEKEAVWYKARNIPYDAVDYRVFKENSDVYEFTFINSKLFRNGNFEYKRNEYIAHKYRGMSYTEMADKLCKTENDIYSLQVDIKYKLNILLYKDPTKYLNYVRNSEQRKYKCRENYWKNRQ